MLRQDIGWFDDKSNGTGTLCSRLSTDAAAVQGVRHFYYKQRHIPLHAY